MDADCWNRIFPVSCLWLGDVCGCVLLGSYVLLFNHLHDNDLHQDSTGALDHCGVYTNFSSMLMVYLFVLITLIQQCTRCVIFS